MHHLPPLLDRSSLRPGGHYVRRALRLYPESHSQGTPTLPYIRVPTCNSLFSHLSASSLKYSTCTRTRRVKAQYVYD